MLSPEEIEQANFSSNSSGYDEEEVTNFLERVAEQVRDLDEKARAGQEILEQPYLALGQEIGDLLQTSQNHAATLQGDAEAEATRRIDDATREAARLKLEADELKAKTEQNADALTAKTQQETDDLKARTQEQAQATLDDAEARLAAAVEQAQAMRDKAEADIAAMLEDARAKAAALMAEAQEDAAILRDQTAREVAERKFEAEKKVRELKQAHELVNQRAATLKRKIEGLQKRELGEDTDDESELEEPSPDRVVIITDETRRGRGSTAR